MQDLDALLRSMTPDTITPVFQPIVDLFKGSVVAYEVLSRRPDPYASPLTLFNRARALDLAWELESACRAGAIRKIASIADVDDVQWYLNVSPEVFSDPRFRTEHTIDEITGSRLNPQSIVLEITERYSITDTRPFQDSIRFYSEHGFTSLSMTSGAATAAW